jgi:hypothetical protein
MKSCIFNCQVTSDQNYSYEKGAGLTTKICHRSTSSPATDNGTVDAEWFRKDTVNLKWVNDCLFSRVSKICQRQDIIFSGNTLGNVAACWPVGQTISSREMFRVDTWASGDENTTLTTLTSNVHLGMFPGGRLLQTKISD